MSKYFLPRHVHFCCRGDALVFLDLKRDDYILVNGPAAEALRAQLAPKNSDGARGEDASDKLAELVDGGLLTSSQEATVRPLAPTVLEKANTPLLEQDALEEAPTLSPLLILRFIAACALTSIRLRFEPLERTIARVERRKARAGHETLDIAKARELTAAFNAMRYLFPRDYVCLYDSLALVEFLARYQVFPTVVFGVRLEPWAAHCWVQEREFTFNEEVEEAAAYTPIMAI